VRAGHLDSPERFQLIERYRDGARAVSEAVASLSLTGLDRHAGGDWCAREVVHHLADAELHEAVRLRRILVEERPELLYVDEAAYARRLHYNRPVAASLQVFVAARVVNAELLELLEEADWQRFGMHSVTGRHSLEDWLVKTAEHGHDHAAQLLRAAGHDVI